MSRLLPSMGALIGFTLIASAFAYDSDYSRTQGEVMNSSPPRFLLVSEVDPEAGTLVGMSTIERHKPQRVVSAFHMTFQLSDLNITNARRVSLDDSELTALQGKLVVLYDGAKPLSAPYMSLFQEDTIIISVKQPQQPGRREE